MLFLYWYVVFVFVMSNATEYYKIAKGKGDWVLGGYIGHTIQVIAHAIFLFHVYPLIK